MKERVLRFVELHETASFTMIQRFIVDTRFGAGTYDNGTRIEFDYIWHGAEVVKVPRKRNGYRGHYCIAFSGTTSRPGYFMVGADRLVKTKSGVYRVIRGK